MGLEDLPVAEEQEADVWRRSTAIDAAGTTTAGPKSPPMASSAMRISVAYALSPTARNQRAWAPGAARTIASSTLKATAQGKASSDTGTPERRSRHAPLPGSNGEDPIAGRPCFKPRSGPGFNISNSLRRLLRASQAGRRAWRNPAGRGARKCAGPLSRRFVAGAGFSERPRTRARIPCLQGLAAGFPDAWARVNSQSRPLPVVCEEPDRHLRSSASVEGQADFMQNREWRELFDELNL